MEMKFQLSNTWKKTYLNLNMVIINNIFNIYLYKKNALNILENAPNPLNDTSICLGRTRELKDTTKSSFHII